MTSLLRIHDDAITNITALESNRALTCSLDGTILCLDLDNPQPRDVVDLEVPIRSISVLGDKIVVLAGINTLCLLQTKDDFKVSPVKQTFSLVWSFNLMNEHLVLVRLIDEQLYFSDAYNNLKRFPLASVTNDVLPSNKTSIPRVVSSPHHGDWIKDVINLDADRLVTVAEDNSARIVDKKSRRKG